MARRVNHPWTEEEIDIIRRRCGELDDAALAELLGRSMGSVAWQRLKLGLKREQYRHGHRYLARDGRR
jgi:hypothetical protein